MNQEQNRPFDPINYLIDSFWATLPEEAANDLATFKKDVLLGIKNCVDTFVEREIQATDWHLNNARDIRNKYRARYAASDDHVVI